MRSQRAHLHQRQCTAPLGGERSDQRLQAVAHGAHHIRLLRHGTAVRLDSK